MTMERFLTDQALAHPATGPRDIIKQCYQAAYGAEHLLADKEKAYAYLMQEYSQVSADETLPLYEAISPQVCRINLAAWKHKDLPLSWLFSMFAASASVSVDRQAAAKQFLSYLDQASVMIQTGGLPVSFSANEWIDALNDYKATAMTAVHHSDTYRQAEHPAYRIVRYEYVRLLPILEAAAAHFHAQSDTSSYSPCIIAMDGRAASGKTTMADQLATILDADVIRMDDFFLPIALRSPERLATPGGNVHYERFMEEVLPHLRDCQSFSYRRFDCHIIDYSGMRQIRETATRSTVRQFPIRIVEGSYSHHPQLRDYADITVFSTVNPDVQMKRILHRNGPQMAQMFQERWIPMEENYFQQFQIQQNANLTIDSSLLF